MDTENIIPEAANLFYAIRSMGYENTVAVEDLIDNSIDAKAKNIWVTVDPDLKFISIADDGTGMSPAIMTKALTLGGKKEHDTEHELGKYGLGLIAASLSMGRRIQIVTKNEGYYRTGILDYDRIQRENAFRADFYESTEPQKRSFDFRTDNAESGTVLVVENCEKLQYATADAFSKDLKDSIGEVFRWYISRGSKIFLNNEELKPDDPLFLTRSSTKKLVDDDVDVDLDDGTKGIMHVIMAQIEDQGEAMNRKLGINIMNQGFYILRNGRQIAKALEFEEIYKKHNYLNTIRIQVDFSSSLDDYMGINLKKHDVAPKREIVNILKNLLGEKITEARSEITKMQKERIAKRKEDKNPFKKEVKVDAKTEPVMAMTEKTIVKPVLGADTPIEQPKIEKEKPLECNFSIYAGSEEDAIFKVSVQDNVVQIRYNMKNKFYARNILEDVNGVRMKKVLDAMILSSVKSVETNFGVGRVAEFLDAVAEDFKIEE